MSKKNNTQTKQKNYVRVISLILAFLMLAGAATVIFSIFGSIASEEHDDHEGHNHAVFEYVEYI